MRKTLAALCAASMLMVSGASAQELPVLKVNYAPPSSSIQKLMAPIKKMSPVPDRSAWICYTQVGTCHVPYLGACSCCFGYYGCYYGST